MMTAAERLIEQGERIGELKGEARGKIEGKIEGELNGRRDLVRKLLTLKFGKLDAITDQRVTAATLEELELWATRILFASSISAVFEG